MTNTKCVSEKSRCFENRSIPSHHFDSPSVTDIDVTQPAFPLER